MCGDYPFESSATYNTHTQTRAHQMCIHAKFSQCAMQCGCDINWSTVQEWWQLYIQREYWTNMAEESTCHEWPSHVMAMMEIKWQSLSCNLFAECLADLVDHHVSVVFRGGLPMISDEKYVFVIWKASTLTVGLEYCKQTTRFRTACVEYCKQKTRFSTACVEYCKQTARFTAAGLEYCKQTTRFSTACVEYCKQTTHFTTAGLEYCKQTAHFTAAGLEYCKQTAHFITACLAGLKGLTLKKKTIFRRCVSLYLAWAPALSKKKNNLSDRFGGSAGIVLDNMASTSTATEQLDN